MIGADPRKTFISSAGSRDSTGSLGTLPGVPEMPTVTSTPIPQLTAAPALDVSMSDDASRLAQAQAGDPKALEWLVQGHWQRVRRLLLRVFGARQDLDDLVQTTFLETLRSLPAYRGESSLSTFISAIAVRVGRRARRPPMMVVHSQSLEVSAEPSSPAVSAEQQLIQRETLRRVQAVLLRLSEPKRIAFMLWAVEGLPVEDVAAIMQASVAATRSRLFYAQRELKAAATRDPYLRDWLERGSR